MSAKAMLDAVVMKCVKCGKTTCRCWVTIRCPCCKLARTVERMKGDPKSGEADVWCPECVDQAGDCDHGVDSDSGRLDKP